MYLVKTPWFIKKIFPKFVWSIDTIEKNIYLTFDDGPHESITPFVLDILNSFNAKASFFCIGKNVEAHPDVYARIINEGHQIGNHTQHHLNGWKNNKATYISNIALARMCIDSNLFRPPYGKLKKNQSNAIRKMNYNIIMWDVLSGDFDKKISKEKCLQNVITNTEQGSIVVFHDSEKAFEKLQFCLPKVLYHFSNLGFTFKALPTFK
jgi:peptidoglycan-N-acetylglucosamine deacetylase